MKEAFPKNLKNEEVIKTSELTDLESAQKENLELKQKLKEQAETLENLRGIFSIATHDVRNSISNIIGFTDLLEERVRGKQTEESILYTEIIKKSGNSSLHLIEELSGWVRLQFNMEKNEFNQIKIQNKVSEIIDSFETRLEKKGIKINNEVISSQEVFFDQNILSTVIRNLISNAIKFTPENGTISVSSEENEDSVKIYIKDSGMGISKEKILKLFDKIEAGTVGTGNEKGMGLGLYLCNKFINKKGGSLEAYSEGEGKGSTFTITIPKKVN